MNNNYFTNPKAPTIAETYDSSLDTASSVTLNASTTYILVSAMAKGIFMKWDGAPTSSDFDEFISPDQTNLYVVQDGASTVQFLEEAASARLVVIQK